MIHLQHLLVLAPKAIVVAWAHDPFLVTTPKDLCSSSKSLGALWELRKCHLVCPKIALDALRLLPRHCPGASTAPHRLAAGASFCIRNLVASKLGEWTSKVRRFHGMYALSGWMTMPFL